MCIAPPQSISFGPITCSRETLPRPYHTITRCCPGMAVSVCSPKKTTWKLQIYRICYVYVPLVIITQTTTRVVSLSTMTDMGRIYRYPESGIDMGSSGKCRRGGPWKRVYNNHTVVGLGIPKNIHIDSQQPHIELSSAYYQLRQYSPNKIQQQQS